MKCPVTIQFKSDKVDLVVEGKNIREIINNARTLGMDILPSFGGDDIGMAINVHVKLPLKEGK